jgi:hypothetical protein
MTDYNTNAPATTTRPTLLTVLCILSFIGGAWGIISGIQSLTSNSAAEMAEMQAQMDEARSQMGDEASGMVGGMMDGAMEIAQKAAENAVPIGITTIVLALVSILGVWQMWNLKKSGFYLYTVAALLGLAVPLFFMGFSMMALMSVGIAGIFSILFIILYAMNLKYMH